MFFFYFQRENINRSFFVFFPLLCVYFIARQAKKKKRGKYEATKTFGAWGETETQQLNMQMLRDQMPSISFWKKKGGGIYSSTSYVAFLFSIVSGVSCVGGLTRDLQLDECVLSLQFKECKRLERIWPIPIVFHKTFFFFFLRAKVHGHCERYTKKTAG